MQRIKNLVNQGDIYLGFQSMLTLHISVHPCDRDHGCEETCVKDKTPKKFHCSCTTPGTKLAADGIKCEESMYQCFFNGKP